MAKSKDPITLAGDFFNEFLTKADPESTSQAPKNDKRAKAQAAGRRGGLKGGKARAASLSPRKRKTLAKKAAAARWKKPDKATSE